MKRNGWIESAADAAYAGDDETGSSAAVARDRCETSIDKAFHERIRIHLRNVRVKVSGRTIMLAGEVRSWAERDEIWLAAWATPGVVDVEDKMTIYAPPDDSITKMETMVAPIQ